MYKYKVSYMVWQYGSSFPKMMNYESKQDLDTYKSFDDLAKFISKTIEDGNSVAIINIFPVNE